MQYIICHYDEIGLKGKNRNFFENTLVKNIKNSLRTEDSESFEYVKRISGRVIVKLSEKCEAPSASHLKDALKNVFGISYFSFAVSTKQDMASIKKSSLEILEDKKFSTFRISTQRSKKEFPQTSPEINADVGAYIVEKLGKKVKLKKSNMELFIEIVDSFAFLYTERVAGPGGLPVGVSGKVVTLLSGGIDSPVAAYFILKRGAPNVFVHFHSSPFTSPASIEKVKKLAEILKKFQPEKTKLYLVPFAETQKEIMKKVPEKFRVIFYRRFMMRIAEEIVKKEKAGALVTGEALGQVASQTVENIAATSEVTTLPIFRPLIGFDKKEIIEKAKEIGTYDTSILPHEDCCSLFIPKSPETRAKLPEVKLAEKNLDVGKLVSEIIKNIELIRI